VDLYPAIDLLNGRCVRLRYGDYSRETRYDVDPIAVARAFVSAGTPWIHVVDLAAARGDGPENLAIVADIANVATSNGARVQAGGGVRDEPAAKTLFDAGVHRVVIGTAAVRNPELVSDLAAAGHGVAVGLDVREGEVAIDGWRELSGRTLGEMLMRFEDVGAEAVVTTFIERDGTLEGPDIEGYARVLADTSLDVIASGGVGSADDLTALAELCVDGRRLEGAIVGKALHDEVLTIERALAAVQQ